ncbi:FecR family protein [Pedobacter frigoris]|uniref:FecR family protein n=1 Tax=Pedobacter frigoris TaxID=2571272 RepID=UPI0029313E5D|nr:FecR domain-containing protein [Pedobacter frigoris]
MDSDNSMENKALHELLDRYQKGGASAEDIAFLESWYLQYNKEHRFEMTEAELEEDRQLIWKSIQQERVVETPVRKAKLWSSGTFRIAIAAAVAIILLGVYFFNTTSQPAKIKSENPVLVNDVKAGGNKALLTLADGRRIVLTDAVNGELAKQAGVRITKTKDGQLVYTVENTGHETKPEYNTIETPRGGQHIVNLPDGSIVVLNAASSLKFPTTFSSFQERKVELSGEAYFEISKDKAHPFVVKTNGQEVKVLGTHFNINSYADEGVVRTTLLEGSVRVISLLSSRANAKDPDPSELGMTNSIMLRPNQQSMVTTNGNIKVQTVDTEDVVAWKNGLFIFNDESLESIMRKVSRWYDVEVVYQDKLPRVSFLGALSRSKNLSALINILEESGEVHFKIQGRRIVVMK